MIDEKLPSAVILHIGCHNLGIDVEFSFFSIFVKFTNLNFSTIFSNFCF